MKLQTPKLNYILLGVFLFFLDQLTKLFAYQNKLGFLNKLNPIFGFQIFPNYNFAFSLKVPVVLMYLIYAILILGLSYYWYKHPEQNKKFRIGVILILIGALSNISDRLLLGFVRDFISSFWHGVFNLADIYIVVGVFLLF